MSTGTKNLTEAVVCVAGLVDDCFKAYLNDKKISVWEVTTIIGGNLTASVAAFAGITEIPSELADLTPEELDEMYSPVMERLQWTDYETGKNIFDSLFNWVHGTLLTFQRLRDLIHPPKAEVMQEFDLSNLPGNEDPP